MWATWRGPTDPGRVSKLCVSRAACPYPDSRGAVDNSVRRNHLLSEQIDQQQGCVALRAVTAQSDGTIKELAIWAAALADEALTATLAFVDGVRHYCAAALEFLAEALQVRQLGLVTEAKRALLVGARAIPRTR